MNRVEELTSKLIDGDISDDEFDELERLLADNPQAVPRARVAAGCRGRIA